MSGAQDPAASSLSDPFAFSATPNDAPGLLGIPVSTWQSLARFGGNLAAAANARTPQGFLANGTGLAGPLGAATTESFNQGAQLANMRSQMQERGAATQGRQIENRIAASGLPLALAKNKMLTDAYSNLPGLLSQANGTPGQQPGQQPGQPGDFQSALGASESGNDPSKVNGQGFVGQYQFGAPRLAELGLYQPAQGENLKANQWQGTFSVPGMPQVKSVNDFLSSPQAQSIAFKTHLENIDQNIAQTPGAQQFDPNGLRAVAHLGGIGGMQNFIRTGGQFNPADANGTSLSNYYSRFSGAAAPSAQGPGPMVPGGRSGAPAPDPQLLAQSNSLMARAKQSELIRGLGIPVQTDDPAALRTQANAAYEAALAGPKAYGAKAGELPLVGPAEGAKTTAEHGAALPFIGPETAAKAGNQAIDLRAGGMHWDPAKGWIKNPGIIETQDASGNTVPMHAAPGLPGSGEPGTAEPILGPDGQPVITKLPAQKQLAQNKAFEDFAGKDTDSYIAAQNTKSWLQQMDHAADTLNSRGGFLGTGPTAPERLTFASNVNDVLRTAGLPAAFDPSAVASWEELKKATVTAGFELSSHYEGHARQAASTIISATSAVPSASNSPEGFKYVSAGIREAAQNAIDLHEFAKQPVYDQNGNLVKAETDFYKNVPAPMYARRAISTVTPYPVKTDEELNRYLPGTFVNYKGNVVQVPERKGLPPIPDYLRTAQPAAPVQQGGSQ